MPLPFVIGGIAAVAGAAGVGSGIHGGVKMKKANDTMKLAREKQEAAIRRFENKNKEATEIMDQIGKRELKILESFDKFSSLIEKIQGRPEFKTYSVGGIKLPEYESEELKNISAGAGVLLGGLGGAAAGTASGFAAAGATTSAVMALGTASTGTAISTLSGAAATNATLAALGGGATAAGGGGMALGTAVLGGATLGVGLLVGGVIFSVTGSKLSSKADEALVQAKRTEEEVAKICNYLWDLIKTSRSFRDALIKVDELYCQKMTILDCVINVNEKTEWNEFTDKEKKVTENLVLLVGLLYKMCQTKLVVKSDYNEEYNEVNHEEIFKSINDANTILDVVKEK